MMPMQGYEVKACALSLSVTDLRAQIIVGTMGMALSPQTVPSAPPPPVSGRDTVRTIRLNCRRMQIADVRANGISCDFRLADYMRELGGRELCRDLRSLSACAATSLEVAARGELEIYLPSVTMHDGGMKDIDLEIDYSIHMKDDPQGSPVVFSTGGLPEDDHMYTCMGFLASGDISGGCGARCLFPCVDSASARFPMRTFVETKVGHTAIAPGERQRTIRTSSGTMVHEFYHDKPMAPHSFGMAVGDFIHVPHPKHPWLTTYALRSKAGRFAPAHPWPSIAERLDPYVRNLLQYLAIGPDAAPKTYSQIFVASEGGAGPLTYSTLSILPDYFAPDRERQWVSYEKDRDALLAQCIGLASQWLGHGVLLSSQSDAWLPLGLVQFAALQALMGGARGGRGGQGLYSSLLSDWTRRAKESISLPYPGSTRGRPLSRPDAKTRPVDSALWAMCGLSFDSAFACRAALTAHMLEQRASISAFREVLQLLALASAYVPSPATSDMPQVKLSELAFLTLLKSKAGSQAYDINATFIEQWLRRTHVPRFVGEVIYIPKQNRIEVMLRQVAPPPPPPSQDGDGGDAEETPLYVGAIKIRIAEAQCEWDYEKQIDSAEHRWVFDCRTSKKKGKGGRKTEVEVARTKQWKNPEVLDPSKLLSLASSETSKKHWEVTSPVRYVLLDPDQAWIMDLTWRQPEEFWFELLHDPNTKQDIGLRRFSLEQLSQTHVFKADPPGGHLRALSSIAALTQDTTSPDAVRVCAARALAPLNARSPQGSMGMNLILSVFKRLYCEVSGEPKGFSPRAGEYAVRPALLGVIAGMREAATVPEDVKNLIFDSVRLCDSGGDNPLDDGPLIGSLAQEVGRVIAAMELGGGGVQDSTDREDIVLARQWIEATIAFEAACVGSSEASAAVGCIQAMYEMGADAWSFCSYVSRDDDDNGVRWPESVRLEAFRCMALRLFALVLAPPPPQADGVQGTEGGWRFEWLRLAHWLIHAITNNSCHAARAPMLKVLLKAGRDTEEELGGFWPLALPYDDSDDDEDEDGVESQRSLTIAVAETIWSTINRCGAYDPSVRMLSHQLWLAIWGLDEPPALEGMGYTPIPHRGALLDWDKARPPASKAGVIVHIEDLDAIWEQYRAEALASAAAYDAEVDAAMDILEGAEEEVEVEVEEGGIMQDV